MLIPAPIEMLPLLLLRRKRMNELFFYWKKKIRSRICFSRKIKALTKKKKVASLLRNKLPKKRDRFQLLELVFENHQEIKLFSVYV